ncbi:RNA methyltransferase [bacterium CG_4_9_14_3_um_filter_65_15]|nr:MAG: RNA methyltransferase [bacterium CG_4_9_14_3_um_filter_65_15]
MFLYQQRGEFFAQTAGGLEELASRELESLGATAVHVAKRGMTFEADLDTLCRVNYRARLLSRVVAPLIRFKAETPEQLYLGAKKIDWTRLMRLDQTFAVFANVNRSGIDHSQFAALKVKDCVADMFRKRYRGKRPNVDPREPDLWISVHILEDDVTVGIDCSGGSLHRRSYRQESVEAPMQETLAAAILDLAEWDGRRPVYDPMCGSGTLLSEAWIKCGNIPAGTLRKKFGFMLLPDFDRRVWFKVKLQEDNKMCSVRGGLIRGSDIDPSAVAMTRRNNARLPGGDELRVRTADFRDLAPLENHLILCNPPYGIRMKQGEDMAAFMQDFGDFLKQKCTGSEAWIYLGDPELVKSIGLKAARRVPLRNGGLDGRLVKFELY